MKLSPIQRYFIVLVVLLSGYTPAAVGGASLVHVYSPEVLLSRGTYSDVVAATVVAIDGEKQSTNGDPPIIVLSVSQVLAGTAITGPLRALWMPYPHDIDWTGKGTAEQIKKWANFPLYPPAVGTEWILAGDLSKKPAMFNVAPTARWGLTEANLRLVIEHLKKRHRSQEQAD